MFSSGHRPGCIGVSFEALILSWLTTYQKGFKRARHVCLQVTGSYCRRGVSGFSFKGVYNAPMGTTSLEASCQEVRADLNSN